MIAYFFVCSYVLAVAILGVYAYVSKQVSDHHSNAGAITAATVLILDVIVFLFMSVLSPTFAGNLLLSLVELCWSLTSIH